MMVVKPIGRYKSINANILSISLIVTIEALYKSELCLLLNFVTMYHVCFRISQKYELCAFNCFNSTV
jgi:hypothetical protein